MKIKSTIPIQAKSIVNWDKVVAAVKAGEPLPQIKAALIAAFSDYTKEMSATPLRGAKLQGVDSNLEGSAPIVEVFSDPESPVDPDRGYELLFQEKDMRNATSRTLEILDIVGGMTFYQQETGGEPKLSQLGNTDKSSLTMMRFTGGINILDDFLRFNEHYKIQEIFEDAMISWFDNKATIFYGLLDALSAAIDVGWDIDLSSTINKACVDLIEANKTKKALKGKKQFVITCPESARFKMAKALAASFKNANDNVNEIVYSIAAIVPTTYLADNTKAYVSLARGKNIKAEWDDFHAEETQRDALHRGDTHVWTGAFAAGIFDANQHRRIPLSA